MNKLYVISKLSEAISHILNDRTHQALEAIKIAYAYTDPNATSKRPENENANAKQPSRQ